MASQWFYQSMGARRLFSLIVKLAVLYIFGLTSGEALTVFAQPPGETDEVRLFQSLLLRHEGLDRRQLLAELPKRDYLEKLSFDPTKAKYFDRVAAQLEMTETELDIFRRHGFVCADHEQVYSFPSMYYAIYSHDLPVLITADSVLYAVHESFDEMLGDIELYSMQFMLDGILRGCHDRLAEIYNKQLDKISIESKKSFRDVDLYLTVARNLLAGYGTNKDDQKGKIRPKGKLEVHSHCGQDEAVKKILNLITRLSLQHPANSTPTKIYGGRRFIDYSQFRPRGRYAGLGYGDLKPYFKCMMWLGRADCGWHVMSPGAETGIRVDSERELRNAVLLTCLLMETKQIESLKDMQDALDGMVGCSDGLTPFKMTAILTAQKVLSVDDLMAQDKLGKVRDAILSSGTGKSWIRSQVIMSDRDNSLPVEVPQVFQLFGQRYTIDSFVLSNLVYDSIVFQKRKIERMMPAGLDVMAALGNDTAVVLLQDELDKYHYAPNLAAVREIVAEHRPEFWQASLYNISLNYICALDDDMTAERHAPEVMRTRLWQRKELQSQLASWSELRHDICLYGGESYTGGYFCEYPTGYVEPYPKVYAGLKRFSDEAARRMSRLKFLPKQKDKSAPSRDDMVRYFQKSGEILAKLESLAQKELAAKPFTSEEQLWLKKTIDKGGKTSGPPQYNGWYSDLIYHRENDLAAWHPTVVDVHTDPQSQTVLQAATGTPCFCIIAIDNEKDRTVYVGPVYSYYEFVCTSAKRLTDEEWREMFYSTRFPQRPPWVKEFQAPPKQRTLGKKK